MKDKIFLSMASEDKEFAINLLRQARKVRLDIWAMFTEYGDNRNLMGDDFIKNEREVLNNTAIFILLYSKKSVYKTEVKRELSIYRELKKKNPKQIHFIGLCIDPEIETVHDMDDSVKDLFVESRIMGLYNDFFNVDGSFNQETMHQKLIEISSKRYEKMALWYQQELMDIKMSYIFYDLKHEYMKLDCIVRSVSEDILDSSEANIDNMKEFHILTNEANNYDYTTVSTMIIARNLLGRPKYHENKVIYDPKTNGLKYYYYIPEANYNDGIRSRLKNFINRDKTSRGEVALWLIKLYAKNQNLVEKLKILKENPIRFDFDETMDQMLISSMNCAIENNKVIVDVPNWFIRWIGPEWDANLNQITYERLNKIKGLLKIYNTVIEDNQNKSDYFNDIYDDIRMITKFYLWQTGELELSILDVNKYRRVFIPKKLGNNDNLNFSIFESWINDIELKVSQSVDIPENIIQEALNNYYVFKLKKQDIIKLTHSFILNIPKRGPIESSWYTTESDSTEGLISYGENNVVSHDENNIEINKRLVVAFKILIDLDPQIKRVLEINNSYFREEKK